MSAPLDDAPVANAPLEALQASALPDPELEPEPVGPPGAERGPSPPSAVALLARLAEEAYVIRGAILIVALGILVGFLHIASPILIPILLAVFLSYILNPVVRWVHERRLPLVGQIPRSVSAFGVVTVAVSLTAVLGVFIVDQARRLALELPLYAGRIREQVAALRAQVMDLQGHLDGVLSPMRRSYDPLGDAVPGTRDFMGPGSGERVQVLLEQDAMSDLLSSVTGFIAGGLTGLLGLMAQGLTCIFVLFFILSEAPAFRQKAMAIMGRDARRRHQVQQILQNVNDDIQRYLVNRVATNAVVTLLVTVSFYFYGLKYAFLVGIFAGIFNFIPYVGPIIGTIFPALIAYMQFGDFASVFTACLIYGAITGLEGNLVTPIVIGRHLKLNSLAVLLATVFWGWLWGAIGLLLAIPMVAAVKAVSEHVESLWPVRELLRGE